MEWKVAKVISLEQITPSVRSFCVRNVSGIPFSFKAGQFITLDLPISDKKSKRVRSYSIASPPHETDKIEMIISLATPSEGGSKFLFEQVRVGSELTYRGPSGVFVLPEQVNDDMVFICTGTGVAPFISMIKELLLHRKNTTQQLTLIFGCRKKEDQIYGTMLHELQEQHPNFRYIPTLSKEQWQGAMGYVHHCYEHLAPQLNANTQFYLCGWRAMVDEAREKIVRFGFPETSIHFELYG